MVTHHNFLRDTLAGFCHKVTWLKGLLSNWQVFLLRCLLLVVVEPFISYAVRLVASFKQVVGKPDVWL